MNSGLEINGLVVCIEHLEAIRLKMEEPDVELLLKNLWLTVIYIFMKQNHDDIGWLDIRDGFASNDSDQLKKTYRQLWKKELENGLKKEGIIRSDSDVL